MELRVECTRGGYNHTLVSLRREQVGFSSWTHRTWFLTRDDPPLWFLAPPERQEYEDVMNRLRRGEPPRPRVY